MDKSGWSKWKWWILTPLIIILSVVISRSVYNVGAGNVAVLFDPFSGGVQTEESQEGIHVKMPWVSIFTYNAKLQEYTMSIVPQEPGGVSDVVRTVTNEGLYVDLDITVWFKIVSEKADEIRKYIGREGEYQEIVVRPTIRSAIREVVSKHSAAEVYGEGRATVEGEVYDEVSATLAPRDILVQKVLLRDVGLPAQLTLSIEAKKQAEQDALRMQYVLQKETLEAERKVIEAGGISNANKIIANSLTPAYLSWYWIENVVKNPNAIIYLVPGEGGLPVFNIPITPPAEQTTPTVPVPVEPTPPEEVK